MRDTVSKRVGDGTVEIDMLKVLGTTSLEFIGQAGLGYSFAAEGGDTMDGLKQLLSVHFHY